MSRSALDDDRFAGATAIKHKQRASFEEFVIQTFSVCDKWQEIWEKIELQLRVNTFIIFVPFIYPLKHGRQGVIQQTGNNIIWWATMMCQLQQQGTSYLRLNTRDSLIQALDARQQRHAHPLNDPHVRGTISDAPVRTDFARRQKASSHMLFAR
jgi:hypothetical protein